MSRDITETTPLTYLARALLDLVPRPSWSKHLASRPIKPLVLSTPQHEKKQMIVEVVESEKIKAIGTTHDAEVQSDEAAKAEDERVPQVCAKKKTQMWNR